MKQPQHYVKPKHRTCSTPTGRRRSPVCGPSYDAGIALLDETTGKTINRKHTDGTKIIFTEIYSNEDDCIYTDKSKSIRDRLTRLWNDVYSQNASDKERIALYGEMNIPYCFSDEESKEFAKRIGEYFATTYNRVCQISIHKKKGRCHIHFNLTEREYKKGKFLQKRKKIYKDMQGNLIYDKNYKDSRGWDIRQPIIDNNKVPAGADPYARDKISGDYLYQKKGERNKKLWKSDTSTGKWFETDEITKFHDDIDKIANQLLIECGYNTTVKRTPKKVAKMIKDLGIEQVRIPTRDFKTNSPVVAEIKLKNEQNKILRDALTENYINQQLNKYDIVEAKEQEISAIKNEISATEAREEAEKILANTKKELQIAEQEYQKALKAYDASLAKKFSFSGTEQENKILFVKNLKDVTPGETKENAKFLEAVNKERDKYKKIVVNAVLRKLTQTDYKYILDNATKKDIESGNFAESFLMRKKDGLERFARRYKEKDKFDIYDYWSKSAQTLYRKIHNQNTKDHQKAVKQAQQSQQIDGR